MNCVRSKCHRSAILHLKITLVSKVVEELALLLHAPFKHTFINPMKRWCCCWPLQIAMGSFGRHENKADSDTPACVKNRFKWTRVMQTGLDTVEAQAAYFPPS